MIQNESSPRSAQAGSKHTRLYVGAVAAVVLAAVGVGGYAVYQNNLTAQAIADYEAQVADCEAKADVGTSALDAVRGSALADLTEAVTAGQESLDGSKDKVADATVREAMQDYLDQADSFLNGEPTYISTVCTATPDERIADDYNEASWDIYTGIVPMNAEIQALTGHITDQVTVIDESVTAKAEADLEKQVKAAEEELAKAEAAGVDESVRDDLKKQIASAKKALESGVGTASAAAEVSKSLTDSASKTAEATKKAEEAKVAAESSNNSSSSGSSGGSSWNSGSSSGSSSSGSSSSGSSSGSNGSSSSGSSSGGSSGSSSGSSGGSSGSSGSSGGGSSSSNPTTQPSRPSVTVAEVAAQLPAPTGTDCAPYMKYSADTPGALISWANNFRAAAPWSRFEASGTDGWVTVTAYTCLKD